MKLLESAERYADHYIKNQDSEYKKASLKYQKYVQLNKLLKHKMEVMDFEKKTFMAHDRLYQLQKDI